MIGLIGDQINATAVRCDFSVNMCVEMIDVHLNMISGLSEGTHAVDASSTDCSLIEVMCAFKPFLQHNIVRMCLKPIREVRDILHHYLLSVSVTSCLF